MAEHKPEDEGITLIGHGEHGPRKKKAHLSSKELVKAAILELEAHEMVFTREEIVEHALHHKFPKAEINAVIDELIAEGYLQHVRGSENLLTRGVWRDYSPAGEEYPEF